MMTSVLYVTLSRHGAGQQRNADCDDRKHMAAALFGLTELTRNFVHRAGPEILAAMLPPKHEHVVLLRLSPLQASLYHSCVQVR